MSNPFFTAETKPGGFWFRSDSRQDLYQVLGIPEDADEATIKKAGTGIICEMLRGETDHSWPGLQEVVHSATCLKEIYIVTYCNWGSSPSKTWKYTYSTVQYSLVEAWWKHHGNMEWFCLLAVNRSHALFGWSLDQQAALRYHPDKSPDEASKAKFAEIRSWALWRVISTIITIFKYIIIYIYCNCVNLC